MGLYNKLKGFLFTRQSPKSTVRHVPEQFQLIGGKYEVQQFLGKGGFARVYLVYSPSEGHVYALKTPRYDTLEIRKAFKRETSLLLNLPRHPFLLTGRGVAEEAGRLYLAMDYVSRDEQGRLNLGDYLGQPSGPIDPDTALKWSIQFCCGMQHAVAHDVKVHRDIKPANILITAEGILRIADFGLASAAEEFPETSAGREAARAVDGFSFTVLRTMGQKTVAGTIGYIAPEVFRGEGATVRSDVYSFGCVLWQMATGSRSPPFHAPYSGDLMRHAETIHRLQRRADVPYVESPLWPIIAKCLQADPTKRYCGFSQLKRDLERAMYGRQCQKVRVPTEGEFTVLSLLNNGNALCAIGKSSQAMDSYEQAIKEGGNCPLQLYNKAWYNKGVLLEKLSQFQDALVCFNIAVRNEPGNSNAWFHKARVEERLGWNRSATKSYQKLIRTACPEDSNRVAEARNRYQTLSQKR